MAVYIDGVKVAGFGGRRGEPGPPGKDATINGVPALRIEAGENVTLTQQDGTLTVSATGGGGPDAVTIPGGGEISTPGGLGAGPYRLELTDEWDVPSAEGPGVKSFAGRTGAVEPQAGDYTAEEVGALSVEGGTLTGHLNLKAPGGIFLNADSNNECGIAASQATGLLRIYSPYELILVADKKTVATSKIVENTRKINGKPLSEDVTISAPDVGAPTVEEMNAAIQAAAPSGGVTSFHGRTGDVTPQAGDYTAADIEVITPSGMSATNVQGAVSELFTSVSEGKALIASAVTDKGVFTSADASFQTMRNNILSIKTDTLPANVRKITLSADPPEGGTVSGGGMASDGMTVTVKAIPNTGYKFEDWTEDDIYVTDHNPGAYTFSVTGDQNLVAKFKETGLPVSYTSLQFLVCPSVPYKGLNVIQTDYYVKSTDRIEFKGNFTLNSSSYSNNFIGWGSEQSRADIYVNTSSSYPKGSLIAMYAWGAYARTGVVITDKDVIIIVDLANQKLQAFHNETILTEKSCAYSLYQNGPLCLMGSANSTSITGSTGMTGKFYGTNIYTGDQLIAQYVPCKDNSDESLGVFDLIGRKFFPVIQNPDFPITAGPTG